MEESSSASPASFFDVHAKGVQHEGDQERNEEIEEEEEDDDMGPELLFCCYVYPPLEQGDEPFSSFVSARTDVKELKEMIASFLGFSSSVRFGLETVFLDFHLVIPFSSLLDFLYNSYAANQNLMRSSQPYPISFRAKVLSSPSSFSFSSSSSSTSTPTSHSKEQEKTENNKSGKTIARSKTDITEAEDQEEGGEDELVKDSESGLWENERYFAEYSGIGIHWDMLRDRKRCRKYLEAMEVHKEDFKNKVVMDVGCGTGILSCFAAKMGARRVYSIEASDMWSYAEKITEKNGFGDVIQVIHSRVEDLEKLPGGETEVDIIISEWMGVFLFYESMFDSVVRARDRWLKKPKEGTERGLIFPSEANMYIAPLDFSRWFNPRLSLFTPSITTTETCSVSGSGYGKSGLVCGVDLSPLAEFAKESFTTPCLKGSEVVLPQEVLTPTPYRFLHLDLRTTSLNAFRKFGSDFEFKIPISSSSSSSSSAASSGSPSSSSFATPPFYSETCDNNSASYLTTTSTLPTYPTRCLNGFVCWFDVVFIGSSSSEKVILSTTPFEEATHWRQDVFLFEEILPLQPDTQSREEGKDEVMTVKGRISAKQSRTWRRHYEVKLKFETEDMIYTKQFVL